MPSVGEDVEELELLHTADGKVSWHNNFGKLVVFLELSLCWFSDPAIPVLGVDPTEMDMDIHQKIV